MSILRSHRPLVIIGVATLAVAALALYWEHAHRQDKGANEGKEAVARQAEYRLHLLSLNKDDISFTISRKREPAENSWDCVVEMLSPTDEGHLIRPEGYCKDVSLAVFAPASSGNKEEMLVGLETLQSLTNLPETEEPFHAHTGRQIRDLLQRYLDWAASLSTDPGRSHIPHEILLLGNSALRRLSHHEMERYGELFETSTREIKKRKGSNKKGLEIDRNGRLTIVADFRGVFLGTGGSAPPSEESRTCDDLYRAIQKRCPDCELPLLDKDSEGGESGQVSSAGHPYSAADSLLHLCASACAWPAGPVRCCNKTDTRCIRYALETKRAAKPVAEESCTFTSSFFPSVGAGSSRAQLLDRSRKITWWRLAAARAWLGSNVRLVEEAAAEEKATGKKVVAEYQPPCKTVRLGHTYPPNLLSKVDQALVDPRKDPAGAQQPPALHSILLDISRSTTAGEDQREVDGQIGRLISTLPLLVGAAKREDGQEDRCPHLACAGIFAPKLHWLGRCDAPAEILSNLKKVRKVVKEHERLTEGRTDFGSSMLQAINAPSYAKVEPRITEPGALKSFQPREQLNLIKNDLTVRPGSGPQAMKKPEGLLLFSVIRPQKEAAAPEPPQSPFHIWLVSDCRPDQQCPQDPSDLIRMDLGAIIAPNPAQVVPVVHVPNGSGKPCQASARTCPGQGGAKHPSKVPCCDLLAQRLRASGLLWVKRY